MIIAQKHRPFFLFILSLLFFGSLLDSIIPDFFFNGTLLVNEQLHSSIEAVGAMAAIAMALLLLNFHQDGERKKGEYFLLSMGFLMMGILDAFVAVSVSGRGFNLLHSFRGVFSGLWFVLVWLPGIGENISKIKMVPWIAASVSVLTGFVILQFREFLPLMILNGGFTSFAILINIIAGLLSISTAVYFLLEFLRSSTTESYFFTCMFVLLGLSAYEFPLSITWSEDWWFWHAQRFLAYIVVLYYMFRTFLRVSKELKEMNKQLEQRVAERTAELTIEIAERKRYGRERDEVIVELQDASAQIKTLTGLLPTCASCKKIRDDDGNWSQMEMYIQKHSDATFSHGICPDCVKELYPDIYEQLFNKSPAAEGQA